jgi:bacteriorhodopsin
VLTVHGSDWLWAVFCVYGFVLLAVVVHSRFARQGEKIFHYLFTVSLLVGTICYFAMASDLGSTAIMPANNLSKHPGSRQIFFAKYINWFAAWPPVFVAVGLVSGVSWATIVYNVILGLIYVASFLVSVMTETKYKWGFYTFGLFAWLLLSHSLSMYPLQLHHHIKHLPLLSSTYCHLPPCFLPPLGLLCFNSTFSAFLVLVLTSSRFPFVLVLRFFQPLLTTP